MESLFGSDVDKPSKILIKTSNAVEYIELDIQNAKSLWKNDPINWFVWDNIVVGFS